jgi:hypothetical protein
MNFSRLVYLNCALSFGKNNQYLHRRPQIRNDQRLLVILVTKIIFVVRFEFFTAVTMDNGVFWDVAPCEKRPFFIIFVLLSSHRRRSPSNTVLAIVQTHGFLPYSML